MILYNTKVAGKVHAEGPRRPSGGGKCGATRAPVRLAGGPSSRQPMTWNPVYGWRTFGTTTFPSGVW